MKTKNYSKLVEKYFPDKDPFLKETLIQLLEDNIFAITEKNNKFFISKKSRKNLPVGYILPEEKYNSEKYKNIRKIFPTLEEFRICFYNNLIEIPYCCICGKEKVHLIGNFKFSQTCGSLECQDALHKQTFLKKYGYENPMQSPEIQVKIKQNSLNKYGVENWQSRPEVLQKRIQTNMERYGVPFAQQTEEAKKKQEETNLKKWGYKSTAQNPEVRI